MAAVTRSGEMSWRCVAPESRYSEKSKCLKDIGELILDNGLQLVFYPNELQKYKGLVVGSVLKLVSCGASFSWFYSHEFWDTLVNVKVLHIHGDWHSDEIFFFISKCLNLKTISFTYWKCSTVVPALYALQYLNICLDEIVIDLFGCNDSFFDVVAELRKVLMFVDFKQLKRLMIITPESLPAYDSIIEICTRLKQVLELEGNVMIFFGQEDGTCSKKLLQLGFTGAGWFTVAENNYQYRTNTPNKIYNKFEAYQIVIFGIKVIIGCRHGFYQKHQEIRFKGVNLEEDLAEFKDDNKFVPFHSGYCKTKHIEAPWLDDCVVRANVKSPYEKIVINNRKSSCCRTFVKYKSIEKWHRYGIPGFENTKVQEIVYFYKNTEMYLSNGLMTTLTNKNEEKEFFKIWHGSKRIIFQSTTHDLRNINVIGMREFLEFVEHIEFVGYWWTELFKYILPRLPVTLRAWTLTRISLERQPLREIINNLPSDLFSNIERFHFDGRDTRGDQNIASIFNALLKENVGFKNLSDLFVISDKFSCVQFKSNISKVIDMVENITSDDAIVTLIVTNRVHNKELLKYNFLVSQEYVLFPDKFVDRNCQEYCGLMELHQVERNGLGYLFLQPPSEY